MNKWIEIQRRNAVEREERKKEEERISLLPNFVRQFRKSIRDKENHLERERIQNYLKDNREREERGLRTRTYDEYKEALASICLF